MPNTVCALLKIRHFFKSNGAPVRAIEACGGLDVYLFAYSMEQSRS